MMKLVADALSIAPSLFGSGAEIIGAIVPERSKDVPDAGVVVGTIGAINRTYWTIMITLNDNSTWTIGNLRGRVQSKNWKIGDEVRIVRNLNWISTSKAGGTHYYRIYNGDTDAAADLNGGDAQGRYRALLGK
jgi:hypothetical protein